MSDYCHFDCDVKAKTDKALLLSCDDWEEDHWVPISQVADGDEYEKGMKDATVSIKTWFCEKEGLA